MGRGCGAPVPHGLSGGLIWATLIGFLVWRELPDAGVWAGSAVIIASGVYMVRAEARPVRPS
jgi:drug/metabolite transporter (DMT)-like permease